MPEFKEYIPFTYGELLAGGAILLVTILVISGSRLSRLDSEHAIRAKKPVDIYLQENADLEELSDILLDSAVVKEKEELLWAGRLLGWNNFSEGHYKIEGNYSYDSLLSKIARGIQDPIAITIIPGSGEQRIAGRLISTFKFDSVALYQQMNDSLFLAEMNMERKDLIGRLFPDTYLLYWTATPASVIQRIVDEFNKKVVDQNKDAFESTERTVDEIITLASIIEWEAHNDEEKDMISGLYWNRLNRGMRLQADPTVNFAINERRRLLYEDYEIDHPYNTYINNGLPPGPITNPSYSSIMAALKPAEHDYLYMVASPEGGHLFSETFEEHRRKSAKWRQWIREQYRIKRMQENETGSRQNADTR